MVKHLPAALRGQPPTPAHIAANQNLIQPYLQHHAPLDETGAFNLLHTWLQPNMPESNRWHFGDQIRRWLRRHGKLEHSERSATSLPRPSLYDALIETFPDSPCNSTINFALGSSKLIKQSFWQNPDRLQKTLTFAGASAETLLLELNIADPYHLKNRPERPIKTLYLLDSLYIYNTSLKQNRWTTNHSTTKNLVTG